MSKKKKIIISFLSFAFVVLLSCGIALLPNWNPSPTTPPSDIGQEEGVFETEAATQPTNTSGKWTDSGIRGTSFGGGSGTASDPYIISNAQQLAYLAYMVNNGNSYSGKYFEQTANIDLSAYYWEPIGTSSYSFSGNYTANPFGVITNLYIKSDWAGLFGRVASATISNIGISGGYIEGGEYVGGLVGSGDDITITNCYNTGNVTSTSTYSSYAGGLVGRAEGKTTITNCYNTGDVNSSSNSDFSYAGGLVGYVNYNARIIIENSYNTGNVTSTSSGTASFSDYSYAGGLVGYAYGKTTTITNSYNTGNVTSTTARDKHSYAGGLVGYVNYNARIIIENSYNTGDVNSPTRSYVGGLVGHVNEGTTITIENSYNTGNVTSTSTYSYYAGGLVGDVNRGDLTISNCYNTGDVTGLSTASVTSYVGGIVGYAYRSDLTISNCYNTGDVNSPTRSDVGGLVGYANGGNSLSSCHNIGDISAPSSARVGAIGGYVLSTTFTKCYYYCEGASGGVNGKDVSGTSENANLLGSDIIFRSQSDYTNTALWTEPFWDFDNTWIIVNGKNENYPVLKELTEFTLTVNPNGGTWNGSSSSQNFTQNYATTKSIPNPDAREGYTFKNWSLSGAGSLSGTTFTFGAGDCTLTAQWSINSYSLSVDPNGGSWNGSSSVSSVSQNYATTKSLTAPSRTGYSLGAWVLDGGGRISTFGKLHSKSADPFFMDGTNSTVIYNNSGGGTVTHQYLAASNTDIELPTGARILRIKNAGTSSPGLGGFTNQLPTEPNHIFYTIIYAKIPKGYSIQFGSNSLGTNGSSAWLTDKAGTGDWKIYICKIQCGTDWGSTTNFYYINGGANGTASNPVVWDVAYFGTYDATGLSASGSSSTTPTFTYPASNSSIVALWNLGTFTVTVNPNGGTYNGKTGSQAVSGLYTQTTTIAAPTRYGYNFAGWAISGGNGTLSTFGKVCSASTDPLFTTSNNNVGIYNNSGDKSVTHTLISASSAGLSNWISGGRVLRVKYTGSCTWGNGLVQSISTSANKVFYTMIYAKVPVGYTLEPAYNASGTGATRTWITSNQGTGNWQTYVMRWNCGSSGEFSTIGFWYLLGPSASSSNPVDLDIAYLCSFDATGLSSTTGVATSPFVYTYGTSDVTLFALWEETWLNHTTPFSGSGTEADPYIISSAENLAYLSERVYDGFSTFDNQYFKQTADIDLTKYNWQPIGVEINRSGSSVYCYFSGIYDGNGYTISGLHTPKGSGSLYLAQGLFGMVLVRNTTEIRNVTLENVDVRGGDCVGGLAGWVLSIYDNETVTIENCSVNGKTYGDDAVGGLIGKIETRERGIVEVINCDSDVSVGSLQEDIGGIVGNVENEDGIGKIVISLCNNYGDVVTNSGTYVGGIVGCFENTSSTTACLTLDQNANFGQIQGMQDVGGIIGSARDIANITNNSNMGNVSIIGGKDSAAGIAGYFYSGTMTGNTSFGDITGINYVGGLVGYLQTAIMSSNQVEGTIKGNNYIGGLVGYVAGSSASATDCAVNADVIASSATDNNGLFGRLANSFGITNCYFIGNFKNSSGTALSMTSFTGGGISPIVTNSYIIANGNAPVKKYTSLSSFKESWTIVSGVNDNNPIQKELFYLAGYTGGDALVDEWLG